MDKRNQFTLGHYIAAAFLVLTLLWLSVSTPFVYQSQQAQHQVLAADLSDEDPANEDATNPFSNTTEEKSESGANTLSEFLHEPHQVHHPDEILVKGRKGHPCTLYFAYHPELLSPPPEG